MNNTYPYNYEQTLFDKFTVFVNKDNELEIVNSDYEMLLRNKNTGIAHKQNIYEFIDVIKAICPTKEEQKEFLRTIFN